ncbi:MAG: hypothetical protein B7Y02_12885, partial [Rhodobacterales bacterium 17-64-5]
MKRYSVFALAREALSNHMGWERAWASPQPKAAYDVIIIGAGGHGLATAYYLGKNHGITNVAILEKGWLGGGNTGRNTTIIRSNYLQDSSAAIYEKARSLYETLSQDLNYNAMFSPRGVMMLAQTHHEVRGYLRTVHGPLRLPATELGVRYDTPPPRLVPEFAGLKLVPQPTRWVAAGGTLRARTFATDDAQFVAADALARRRGLAGLVAANGVPVTISRDASLGEDHVLEIAPDGVILRGGSDSSLFSAAMTLLSLRETHGGALPLGRIEDGPRFVWRGQHLDCSRHFFAVSTILKLLDLMALVKLNRFHWHFSDDESFRVQVDCAPEIWRKTEFRGEGHLIPGVWGGGILSGGSYSKADVARVVAHAKALHIEVLPEIEVPAHAHALNAAHPGMRDRGDNGAEMSVHGFLENTLNPAMQASWDLVEPLALEVASLFPLGILHLGCDELPHGAWDGSPAITRLKADLGL